LLQVAIHEVSFLADVQFEQHHLVFGLQSTSVLLLDNVFDLAELALLGHPDLDKTLRAQLLANDVQLGWHWLVLGDSKDSCQELDSDVRAEVCRREWSAALPGGDFAVSLDDEADLRIVLLLRESVHLLHGLVWPDCVARSACPSVRNSASWGVHDRV
jgi:hypothetical protein